MSKNLPESFELILSFQDQSFPSKIGHKITHLPKIGLFLEKPTIYPSCNSSFLYVILYSFHCMNIEKSLGPVQVQFYVDP